MSVMKPMVVESVKNTNATEESVSRPVPTMLSMRGPCLSKSLPATMPMRPMTRAPGSMDQARSGGGEPAQRLQVDGH